MRHVPPPHLPAADLGLTDDELHALLWVTERLEDGRIPDDDFDMEDADCCIAGHMQSRMGRGENHLIDTYPNQIEPLFYPPISRVVINGFVFPIRHQGWTAGPTTAARACRQFLQTGALDWDAAIDGAA